MREFPGCSCLFVFITFLLSKIVEHFKKTKERRPTVGSQGGTDCQLFLDHAEDEPQNDQQQQCQRPSSTSQVTPSKPRQEFHLVMELGMQEHCDADVHENTSDENNKENPKDHF